MMKDSSNHPPFSAELLKQMLNSAEGKQLIALLNRDGGKGMQQAAAEYRKGDVAAAQEALKPLVDTPEAKKLLQKLQKGK